jgi:hypothetical protein
LASGGGGQPGDDSQDGGGGGGSGGAILLEADSHDIDDGAIVAANGGGGAGGQPSTLSSATSEAGEDGNASTAAARGGDGTTYGGDGGAGAALYAGAVRGADGGGTITSAAGGGGGGGVGRIRINGASSCAPEAVLSPQPSISCEGCDDDCPDVPEHGCVGAILDDTFYYVCSSATSLDGALSKCSDSNMALVRIDDQAENDWLTDRILDDIWIGASDAETEDDWRWIEGDVQFWDGDDNGDPVDGLFNAWASNEPNGSGDAARLLASSGSWYDADATSEYGYVCEAP